MSCFKSAPGHHQREVLWPVIPHLLEMKLYTLSFVLVSSPCHSFEYIKENLTQLHAIYGTR